MADSTTTITPDQQEAARKEARAATERTRRATAKALEKAGIEQKPSELTADQKGRAATALEEKPGLGQTALATWILEGKGTSEVVKEAQAARETAKKAETTRTNITRSADPDAAELAAAAKALAPDVRSAFLPKDAREFIDLFTQVKEGQSITVSRVDGDTEVTFKRVDLRKFAAAGEKDKEIRGMLALLGKGTRLWGRKLGLMVLATDAKKA